MKLPELFIETAVIMSLGMGIVFMFLGILVLVIMLMSRMANRFEIESKGGAIKVAVSAPDAVSPEVVSAITIAIKKFKSKT